MEKDYRKLEFEEREIVLRADFTNLDDERCVQVSVRFLVSGPRSPREGEWVYLLDHQGNGCSARSSRSAAGWRGSGRLGLVDGGPGETRLAFGTAFVVSPLSAAAGILPWVSAKNVERGNSSSGGLYMVVTEPPPPQLATRSSSACSRACSA